MRDSYSSLGLSAVIIGGMVGILIADQWLVGTLQFVVVAVCLALISSCVLYNFSNRARMNWQRIRIVRLDVRTSARQPAPEPTNVVLFNGDRTKQPEEPKKARRVN